MDVKKKRKTTMLGRVILIAVLILVYTVECGWSNGYIDVERFEFRDSSVPGNFDGVRIAVVTDYHNHGGRYEDRLVNKIKERSPDYIFFVGDMVDSRLTDLDKFGSFLKKCSEIAPGYLCYGNHELRVERREGGLEEYNRIAKEAGVTIVDNEVVALNRNGETMYLAGTRDTEGAADIAEALKTKDKSAPLLWIHHYPQDFGELSAAAKDSGFERSLIFCGHAHGGLIRIPFTDIGIVAPDQGLFPKYTDGEYFNDGSEMIVSRGCGNTSFTLRTFDPFELVICDLNSDR